MFEALDPRKGKQLKIMNEKGVVGRAGEGIPHMSDDQLLQAYGLMVRARQADLWAVSLNRQGRMPTFPPVEGQEANSVGAALALKNDDWLVQAFRESGALFAREVPLSQQYLLWLGNEVGSKMDPEKYHVLPVSVPIASQLLHGLGLAYAERYRGTDRVSISYVGDGGTSEGDFHEALNFAAVWKAPAIFYIQNNQWAISVPRSRQTASPTLAEKAFAYGMEGVQVDGNDVMAVFAAVSMAAEKARAGDGPTLIEGLTYRMGAHTTADDPTRYRSDEEVASWKEKDPLLRVGMYLKKAGRLGDEDMVKMEKTAKKAAQEAFREAENYPAPTIEDTYRYTYAEMPPVLEHQMKQRKALDTRVAAAAAGRPS